MSSKDQGSNSIPRWIWLLILAMVLMAGAVTAFTVDQYFARRRFDAAVAARRALGEPVLPADFELAPIPDNENAAFFIRRARAAMQLSDDEEKLIDQYTDLWACPPMSRTQQVAELLSRRPTVFAYLAQAQRCPRVVWGTTMTPNPQSKEIHLPHVHTNKELAIFLEAAIRSNHLLGRDVETTTHLRSLLFLADATDQEGPWVMHGVAMDIRGLATYKACQLAPDLDGSTRRAIRTIIAELLDESRERPRITKALYCDRMVSALSLKYVGTESIWIRSWFDRSAAEILERTDAAPSWFFASDYPTARVAMPPPYPPGNPLSVEHQLAWGQDMRSFWCNRQFRMSTHRRAAAIALALRLYALDHANQLPAQLTDLVPAYLPEVPKDPFAAGGKPLNYRPSPRPAIYSVGEDGVDNGMDGKPRRHDARYNEWSAPDAVFYLGPTPPPGETPGQGQREGLPER